MMEKSRIQQQIENRLYSASREASTTPQYAPSNSRSYQCSVDGCSHQAYAKNLCNAHYIRHRSGKSMSMPIRNRKQASDRCSECNELINGKGAWGLCQLHYSKKRARLIKSSLIETLGGKCVDCVGTFPDAAFDFHHLADKTDSVSFLIRNASADEIAEEVAKCELLCANCHRIRHNEI